VLVAELFQSASALASTLYRAKPLEWRRSLAHIASKVVDREARRVVVELGSARRSSVAEIRRVAESASSSTRSTNSRVDAVARRESSVSVKGDGDR